MGFGEVTQLGFRLADPVFLVDHHLDWIHRYVGALETAFSGNGGYSAVALESDRAEFAHRMRSIAPTLSGVDRIFELYYNIDSLDGKESEISGIVAIGEDEFVFTGKLEMQEGETKWIIRSYGSNGISDTYVETKMTLEAQEQKIATRIVENGVLVHESLIKLEIEDHEVKIVVETVSSTDSIVFEIKQEEDDGQMKLKGSYAIDGIDQDEQGTFSIEIFEDPMSSNVYYRYTITSGAQSKVVDKNRVVSIAKTESFETIL